MGMRLWSVKLVYPRVIICYFIKHHNRDRPKGKMCSAARYLLNKCWLRWQQNCRKHSKNLSGIKGIGPEKTNRYGAAILTMIRSYEHQKGGNDEQVTLI